jgi:murein DD-endopeptidase MepM/ murein hydrolase activator NlpD
VTRVVAAAGAALVVTTALASAAPPPRDAVTGASAALVRITIPDAAGVSLGEIAWPSNPSADVQSFGYPENGSVLSIGRSRATVTAAPGEASTAQAYSEALVLSLFQGEIVVGKIVASVTAGASIRAAGAKLEQSEVQGLSALGQSVSTRPGTSVPLADWGTLRVLSQETGIRPTGDPAASGSVVGLRVRLTAPHGGLPAGSEIVVGSAQATAVADVPDRPAPRDPTRPRPEPQPPRTQQPSIPRAPEPDPSGAAIPGGPVRVAPEVSADLSAGGYVFPVFGPVSFGDSFGAPRANVPGGWHHGEDIFAPTGTPLLAVADGTLHTIGFTPIGGYRLWLRDREGNEFYYAHLSAYSPLAVEGKAVEAGDVIGFVGDTGDAEGGTPHLHFEIHPATMLGLGYDGVVAPYPILLAWRRAEDISFAAGRLFAPAGGSGSSLPQPGAVLLQAEDIAGTSGLVPGALERALRGGSRPPG